MTKKTSLHFTSNELAAALAREKRHHMRKRLLALQAVLDGHSDRQAARMTDVSGTSVGRWVQLSRAGGLKAVLAEPHRTPRPLDPGLVADRRAEIAAALRTPLRSRHRRRLRAIDAFLAGQSGETAARLAGVEPHTLNRWIRILFSQGTEAIIPKAKSRRSRVDPPSIPVTNAELAEVLAREEHPGLRKRLLALQAVLRGDSNHEAAQHAEATPNSVARWLKRAREGGLAAVLDNHPRKKPMKPAFIAAMRAEIAAVLKRRLRRRLRLRLSAIDAALAGEPLAIAAALIHIKPRTLKTWLGTIRKHGIAPLLAKWEPFQTTQPKFNVDPATLRAHAASEKNPHIRKRFLALACLAEGFSIDDAAVRVGISTPTVRTSLQRFQQGGIDAIRSKPSYPGPGPKLRPKELEAVAALARSAPPLTPEQLCAYIEAEFGVRYTPGGLKNMLRKQLGFVWTATAPRAATQTHPSVAPG